MYPEFFDDKPIDRLISEVIQAEHMNDKVLGQTLDSLHDAGVNDLYRNLAVKVVNYPKLPYKALNLDGTSFHVGEVYNNHDNRRLELYSYRVVLLAALTAIRLFQTISWRSTKWSRSAPAPNANCPTCACPA
ncbi:DUF4277 domain-containing protein, partial [Endozoicomonas sp. ONNA1]|uniref:DUF4277 domain-containing protein n=1 Tax=Endozoicomonas sp. ONNA1 TaxID=2828740 RepID=UPI0021475FA0